MNKLLFITWDGPQTTYMEGLFMPIFHEISKRKNIEFHIIQFTWGDAEKTNIVKKAAENLGIYYNAFKIHRKPNVVLGSFFTLFTASSKVEKYIIQNKIDVVMPRSTFPAYMVNHIKNKKFKIIFDADGLAIEERVDFSGLKKNSFQYNFLKSTENQMLKNANAILTRSQKAVEIHLQNIGENFRNKFSVVKNGRNKNHFSINSNSRNQARSQLDIHQEFLWIYAGSLGPQYCYNNMLKLLQIKPESKLLILTGNAEYAKANTPKDLQDKVIIKSVKVDEVPFWINTADVAVAFRKPTYSMKGVAPIKLGEYLLCGIPSIASKGIGDTEEILQNFSQCYLYDHHISFENQINDLLAFSEKAKFADKENIRNEAEKYFSLEAAAESYIKALEKLGL